MSSQRNLCVEILELLQENEHRQSALATKIISENPLTVVVLALKVRNCRFIAAAYAQCNDNDRFSWEEGFSIASKRAMRLIADDKKARELVVRKLGWIIGVWK